MKICIAGKNSIAVDGLKYVLAKESIPKENLLILPGPEDTGIDQVDNGGRTHKTRAGFLQNDFLDFSAACIKNKP